MTSKLICSLTLALSLAGVAACRGSSPPPPIPDAPPTPPANGAVTVAWSIASPGQPGQLVTCARIGAAQVSVALHGRSGTDLAFSFPCAATRGAATRIPAGPYDVTFSLRSADGATMTTVPSPEPVTIGAGGVTAVPAVAFTTGLLGKLTLTIATLQTESNCTDRGRGGAGTSGNIITLIRSDGGCAPATFIRSRGNTKLGEYTVNCSSPQIATCIEQDETLTTADLDAGPYTLRVSPLIGAAACSTEIDVVSVPAGATVLKRVQLVPNGAPSGGRSC